MHLSQALAHLEHLWGMRCAGAFMDLPATGASVLRWKRTVSGPFELDLPARPDFVALTFVLQPMQACARVDDSEVWVGQICGGSVRLIEESLHKRVGFSSSTPFDLLHIYLPISGLKLAAQRFHIDLCGFEVRDRSLYHSDEIAQRLGMQLLGALDDHGPAGRMYADGIAQALTARMLHNFGQDAHPVRSGTAEHQGLQFAFEYVEHHPHETLTVARLARLAGMSEFHFARQFRQRYDITPHTHLLAVRLRLAKGDLAFSDKNILQIAMDCGFSDSSHFARLFRRAEGVTPLDYRQAQRRRA